MWRHLSFVEDSLVMDQNVSNWKIHNQYFDIKKEGLKPGCLHMSPGRVEEERAVCPQVCRFRI